MKQTHVKTSAATTVCGRFESRGLRILPSPSSTPRAAKEFMATSGATETSRSPVPSPGE